MKLKIIISTQYGNKTWIARIMEGETQEQAVERVLLQADYFHGGVTLVSALPQSEL